MSLCLCLSGFLLRGYCQKVLSKAGREYKKGLKIFAHYVRIDHFQIMEVFFFEHKNWSFVYTEQGYHFNKKKCVFKPSETIFL